MSSMSQGTPEPRWKPTPEAEFLALVADVHNIARRDPTRLFLAACRADACLHHGKVSVNRVRLRLAAAGVAIPARRYSAMWSAFTGPGKPMVKLKEWEVCAGSLSGNDGRPFALRRWVGDQVAAESAPRPVHA